MSYELWLSEESNRSLVRQEKFILAVTDAIRDALDAKKITKSELADKLGVSRSHVTQLLSGGRNMTLRTLSDIAHACEHVPCFSLRSPGLSTVHLFWAEDACSYRPVQVKTSKHSIVSNDFAFEDIGISVFETEEKAA